jgi:hypothetical protein
VAGAKDDDSTDIEAVVKKFADTMTDECAALRKTRMDETKKSAEKTAKGSKDEKEKKGKKDKPDEPPVVTFVLDPAKETKGRTPAEQAAQVVAGRSWVCWGAHMADKARHVIMKADGKITWDAKKTMAEDFNDFKKAWAKAMSKHGLKNANGKDGWYDGDAFHLELADSKIARTDERVKACFEEYARLSRKEDKGSNDKFEKDYAHDLKPYLDKYPAKAEGKK